LQGSKTYSTERLFVKGYKYVAIGGYVPDHNVLCKLKFDFLVIVEKDDATLLDDLLNTHFQSKLSRDMTKTESVDGGMPIFGQSFEDAGGSKDDYRAIRLKMKGKLDKYGVYVPKARITGVNGELVEDLSTLQGRQAVFFCELYFIKTASADSITYNWSVNIFAMSVRDQIDWLAESTVPENQMDEVGVMLDSIGGDVSSFFSSSSKKKPIVAVGDEVNGDDVSSEKPTDEGHGEFNTPSPQKIKVEPTSAKRKTIQDSGLKTKKSKGTSGVSGRKKLGFADKDKSLKSKQKSKEGTKEKTKKKKTKTMQNQD